MKKYIVPAVVAVVALIAGTAYGAKIPVVKDLAKKLPGAL